MTGPIDRRQFLGGAAVAGATFAVGSGWARGDDAPNGKIVVGVMGLSRGKDLVRGFGRLPNVVVKYACDVDKNRAAEGAKLAEETAGTPAEAITDFRRILDDPEVDALVCAAPNHWHAPATILACLAGKHVYVEKPCSHNPHEGELMVQAARQHKRAVQMGAQRRSSKSVHEAMALLRDGAIGRVYHAQTFYNNTRGSIGRGKQAAVPDYLDYELWQGPAPRTPYRDNVVHYNWHWFWHWGNGELGNNGVHALDLARMGMEVDLPNRVVSLGGRYAFDDDQETPDTHTVAYEFNGKGTITWQGLSCNRHGDGFVKFFGEEGAMDFSGGSNITIFDAANKPIQTINGNNGDREHIEDFLNAIRSDDPLNLNAEIEEGHKSTLLCHLGNIAQRVGRNLACDPSTGHIIGDSEAMTHWQREYAEGWEPKV